MMKKCPTWVFLNPLELLHVPSLIFKALKFSNTVFRGSEKVVKNENFLEFLLDFS